MAHAADAPSSWPARESHWAGPHRGCAQRYQADGARGLGRFRPCGNSMRVCGATGAEAARSCRACSHQSVARGSARHGSSAEGARSAAAAWSAPGGAAPGGQSSNTVKLPAQFATAAVARSACDCRNLEGIQGDLRGKASQGATRLCQSRAG